MEKTTQNQRTFTGIWIPKEIWETEDLSFLEKMLWAEIHSLDGENGCFAKNKYFMDFFDRSESSIRTAISSLEKIGLIEVIWDEETTDRTIFSTLKKFLREFSRGGGGSRKLLGGQQKTAGHRDNNIENKESISKDIDKKDATAEAFAIDLLKQIKDFLPKFSEPKIEKWSKEFEKILRIDKRDPEDIRKVMDFLKSSVFWRKNILSPAKMRSNFDRLMAEIVSQNIPRKETKQKSYEEKVYCGIRLPRDWEEKMERQKKKEEKKNE